MQEIIVPANLTEANRAFTIPCRDWFVVPRRPQELLDKAMECNNALRPDVFFSKRIGTVNIDYLMDAITAGEFAGLIAHRYPCKVSLIASRDEFPDFRIVFDDTARKPMTFEAVWADEKGRKVYLEYKEAQKRKNEWDLARAAAIAEGKDDPSEFLETELYSPEKAVLSAKEAIPRVVAEKAAKGYPTTTRLVVRNNLGTLTGFDYFTLTRPYHQAFGEIWILKAPLLMMVLPKVQQFGDVDKWPLP